MQQNDIVSKINGYLYEASLSLADWLNSILPKVTDTWWHDCVLASLSYTQLEIATEKKFSKLSDFDLAALLRIANKSWYDMRTITYLPTHERECVREMIGVRNNWAHCSAELPGKDTILHDLHILYEFIGQIGGDESMRDDILNTIDFVECPDSIKFISQTNSSEFLHTTKEQNTENIFGMIQEKSLVYLVGSPEIRGIVFSISDIDGVLKYEVFVNGAMRTYYSGQIELVQESAGYNWVDINTFRSYLAAYQINNPSAQNLYSLNSARIDFVPYQFRPALKMIHADEPRILIADSVGVGKTIEAGLIIKELEARSELEKVLIICPRPLVAERKWELEMKRFDEEFTPLDGSLLRQIVSDTNRDGEWPLRYSKAIIPYSILDSRVYNGSNQKRQKEFGLVELDPEPHFDLVIVDEAHHIRNGSVDKDKAFAYKCTKYFCDHADAVVMLTATPLQTSDDDLFTLLNVLRPDIVIDKKSFEMMSRPNEYISRAIHLIRASKENWAKEALQELLEVRKTQWGDNIIAENPVYDDILTRLEQSNITRDERVKLISDVESLHSFSTMLNRTRRRDIQDFCVRRSHTISTEFTQEQRELHNSLLSFEASALSILHNSQSVPFMMSTIKRQAASCIFGLAPHIRDIIARRFIQINDDPEIISTDITLDESSENTFSQLAQSILQLADNLSDEDPKFDKVMEIVKAKQEMKNNKIMLFSTFRHTLVYLRKRFEKEGLRVAQIDGSVQDDQRYDFKERFELDKDSPDALDILLFTEVGSEGLDYQFCDMMINYDLPWNPMRIEQRIGRIDRRGQQSEAVNIYNVITEDTVDADIYYRCLMRIGVFEKSIGECEEILGNVASNIEKIAINSYLTDAERALKLEQVADNEVRKVQELNRLEEEEKELFGFDLSEFTTAQEIRKAENPWITPSGLQLLIEQYFKERITTGANIIGEGPIKNLRVSAQARESLKADERSLPGGRNALKQKWDGFLSGKTPNHSITFDSDAAAKDRSSFFITAMHPLAKQAASYYKTNEPVYLHLNYISTDIPEDTYMFSVYAWKYIGLNDVSRLVTVSTNEIIEKDLPSILDYATTSVEDHKDNQFDWSELETRHVHMLMRARDKHKSEVHTTAAFKIENLGTNHRNRVRSLEQQICDATSSSIQRMRKSELEHAQDNYDIKLQKIKRNEAKADIHAVLLANGIITVKGE